MNAQPAAPAPTNTGSVLAGYTWSISVATVLAGALVLTLGAPSPLASAIIMVTAVALIGLPHGAYDLEVARRLFAGRLGKAWRLLFGGAYLALAALGLGLWLALPWVALTMLLVGGAIHWGLDDLECDNLGRPRRTWLALSRGAIPVASPMAFHAETVSTIFAAILGAEAVDASHVQIAGFAWLLAACPGIVASVLWARSHSTASRLRVLVEPIVLLGWFFVAPPILAFTLYFCFWHSVRHSLRSAMAASPNTSVGSAILEYLKASALPTVLTWVLALAAVLAWSGFGDAVQVSWSIVFIGLFALTIPHVTLEWFEAREHSTPT
ncbi:MAG: Brp/Blh family beta-carotene 15,15'-dioxygenase [Phycisphaerales bacterium]